MRLHRKTFWVASVLFWGVLGVIFIIRFFPLKWRWDTQPFHECDRLSDITIEDDLDFFYVNPRIDCFISEIDRSSDPDIGWCFTPMFENGTYMSPFECSVRIAMKLKSFDTCEAYAQLSNDSGKWKWRCIGAIAKILDDPYKCDTAPTSEMKNYCLDTYPVTYEWHRPYVGFTETLHD